SRVGGIIGTSVSAAVLLLLGAMNAYILARLVQQLRALLRADDVAHGQFQLQGGGCLFTLLKRTFKLVDRPWKMYPLGVLFGLGFDTSSEVALLGISAVEAARGTSFWLILLFPLLFTAGMCMLDTTDGALMMALYTSSALASDKIAVCYYGIVLTGVTVMVAVVIGTLQLLTLVLNVAEPTGRFWDGVQNAGDHYDIIGGSVCGTFLLCGIVAALCYKPWRRRVDAERERRGLGPGGAAREVDSLEDDAGPDRYQDEPLGASDPSSEPAAGASHHTEATRQDGVTNISVTPKNI
ncbi:MAG: hypothetical protein INR71_06975, partial [Terriglobus roseus]|nr:hypothetical protein [Terriglobus roseus]